jgi:hypothetical protein
MNRATFIRLGSFALVLGGSFGTAYGIGTKLPGNPESKPHTHGPAQPSLIPPGFTADGYVLVLEPYVGQAAHLIAIRQGDLAYAHLHPLDSAPGAYVFSGDLPTGTYRLFLQFGYRGDVLTVPFTVVQP